MPRDIIYFEDLAPHAQEVIIDLVVSIIENERHQNEDMGKGKREE